MHLTGQQIHLIRQSHRKLVERASSIGLEFYADLFNRVPESRALFRDDLEGQGMRFMSAIHVIVDNLDNLPGMDAEVERLAVGHAALPIRPDWYRQMQEALIDTFAAALGTDFTNDMELAWRAAFSQICDRMIEKSRHKG